jgi:hypothetical protein
MGDCGCGWPGVWEGTLVLVPIEFAMVIASSFHHAWR